MPRPPVTLRRLGAAGGIALVLLSGCSTGTRLHSEGMRLISEGSREAGLQRLADASRADPTNPQLRIDMLREQMLLARELLEQADDARRQGRAEDAQALYARAAKVQPGNDRALRGILLVQMDARHAQLLGEAERALQEGALERARPPLKTVLTENPASEPAARLAAALAEQQAKLDQAKAAQAASQSILRKPVTLQFRDANLRMVFEALSRTTGLNVILDRDVRSDLRITIFVKDATVEDTVDLILLQSQLEKRTLNASTLFVYPATPAKLKEYQDLQVRTFQIANGDAKQLQATLKALLKLKEIVVDERANTIAIRDTPDAVAVAAKVIAAHDVPEPEVMLEVEVLEISRDRASNIGLQLPTSFSVATPAYANTLGALRDLTRSQLTASGLAATLNLQLEDTEANLLASPRIRARNKEKARILIGDRVPTITNSVTPIQSGGAVVTGSVQYQEVGLKLEFEPTIYNTLEVGIKLTLEVSNIVKTFTDAQGGRSYQIGTRNAQTSLRLRDGETQILGGLISDQDRSSAAKVPGLGHLPYVGSVFGNNDSSRTKTEIILSVTPRIVRAPANVDAALRDVFSGTESSIRERALRLDAVSEFRGGAPQPAAATPASPAPARAPASPVPAPATDSAPAPAAAGTLPAPPATAPVVLPAAAAPAPAAATSTAPGFVSTPIGAAATPVQGDAAAPGGASGELSLQGPGAVRVGETFTVTVVTNGLPALRDMPLTLRFDPTVLRFERAVASARTQAAGLEAPTPRVDMRTGRVDIPFSFAGGSALPGEGALVDLVFTVHTGRASTRILSAQTDALGVDGSTRVAVPGPRNLQLRISP